MNKLRECFDDMVVYKDLKKTNFFSALSLPSFLRDWLLKQFEDENGTLDQEQVKEFIDTYLPKKSDWISIKDRLVNDREHVKFLTKISIDIDVKTNETTFALSDFGLTNKETVIEPHVWETCKEDLISSRDVWGIVELGYKYPDDFDIAFEDNKAKKKSIWDYTYFFSNIV